MNVLIIEDEPLAAERLQQMIVSSYPGMKIAGITDSIEASVNWLTTNAHPQLILMDIELSDGQSFAIFDRVAITSPVIFTTSYDEYAVRAFKVNSIDYLLKPVKIEDFKAAIDKLNNMGKHLPSTPSAAIERLLSELRPADKKYRDRFLVKSGQRYYSIEVQDIAYFFYRNRITYLKTWKKEMYFIDYILDELEDMLSPELFFRANRQYLLHIKSVRDIHSGFNHKLKLILQPPAEDEIIISREKANEFKNWMGK